MVLSWFSMHAPCPYGYVFKLFVLGFFGFSHWFDIFPNIDDIALVRSPVDQEIPHEHDDYV